MALVKSRTIGQRVMREHCRAPGRPTGVSLAMVLSLALVLQGGCRLVGGLVPKTGSKCGSAPCSPDAGEPIDSQDAGRLANAPGPDAGSAGNTPGVFVSGQEVPSALAIDSTNVYWVNLGSTYPSKDGQVMMMPQGGGTPVALATEQKTPYAITVDSDNVYWTNQGSLMGDGTIMAVPIAGGTPTTLASGQGNPTSLAVNSTAVYWVNSDSIALAWAPLHGGTPATLASNGIIEDTYLNGIALSADHVYWADPYHGCVASVPLSGGSVVTLWQQSGWYPDAVAVDSQNVYWVTGGSPTDNNYNDLVVKMPLAGGAATTLATTDGLPETITVANEMVYWFSAPADTGTNGFLGRVPIGGGAAATLDMNPLANGTEPPGPSFAVGNDAIYIVAGYSGQILDLNWN